MKILSIKIQDFLSIGEAELRLADQGLVLIQGVNRDNPSAASNGSGKSSILDAIVWCLYGVTSRDLEPAKVIRDGAKKANVKVALLDEENGDVITVERERTKARGQSQFSIVHANGSTTIPTYGTEKLAQEALERLIGCSADVFLSAVMIGQEGMPDLPAMTDRRLKELVEEAAGVAQLERAYEIARERCKVEEKAFQDLSRAHGLSKAGAQALREEALRLKDNEDAWEKDWSAGFKRASDAEIAAARAASAAEQARVDYEAEAKQARADLAALRAKLAGFQAERDEETRLQGDAIVAAKMAGETEAAIRGVLAQIKRRETEFAKLEAEAALPCETCGNVVAPAALKRAVEASRDALQAARDEGRKLAGVLKGQRERAAQTTAALDAYRAGMSDPSAIEAAIVPLEQVLVNQRALEARAENLRQQLAAATTALNEQRAMRNPFVAPREEIQRRIVDKDNETFSLEGQVQAAQERLDLVQAAVKVFGPAGVRAQVLDQVTPYLNAQTATYLDALSDGTIKAVWSTLTKDARGNLKERFAIEVTHPAGEGFKSLSGGEKRRVRIACALALQDLVASRASKPLALFCADELDDALDTPGLERLMVVLQEKAKQQGTVLVISHNDLREWIPVIWTVTKENGDSSIECC